MPGLHPGFFFVRQNHFQLATVWHTVVCFLAMKPARGEMLRQRTVRRTTVYVSEEVRYWAKENRINVSATLESALRRAMAANRCPSCSQTLPK